MSECAASAVSSLSLSLLSLSLSFTLPQHTHTHRGKHDLQAHLFPTPVEAALPALRWVQL